MLESLTSDSTLARVTPLDEHPCKSTGRGADMGHEHGISSRRAGREGTASSEAKPSKPHKCTADHGEDFFGV